MIKEDYVSFEIAKLLKEKGFDVNAINSWHIVPSETCNFEDLEKIVCGDINEPEYSKDYYPMITLQMAMKWLREIHSLLIVIDKGENFYAWQLEDNESGAYIGEFVGECASYEEACEEAIKYCLENLI